MDNGLLKHSWFSRWITLFAWLGYLFLAIPTLVIVLSAFSPTPYPSFPPESLSLKWFGEVFGDADWMHAIWMSAVLVLVVTPITTVLGSLPAYGLRRVGGRLHSLLQTFLLSPLMVPEIVLGMALLYLFIALGMNGSFFALVAGHALICFPYVVRNVSVSLAGIDPKLEDAALNLGASRWAVFRTIIIPLALPGIIAGAIFSSVMSLGEVSISLLVSAPDTITVPVRVFSYIDQTFDPSVNAVAVIFIAIAVVAMLALDRVIGLQRVF